LIVRYPEPLASRPVHRGWKHAIRTGAKVSVNNPIEPFALHTEAATSA